MAGNVKGDEEEKEEETEETEEKQERSGERRKGTNRDADLKAEQGEEKWKGGRKEIESRERGHGKVADCDGRGRGGGRKVTERQIAALD